jgi:phage-related minor tail protein
MEGGMIPWNRDNPVVDLIKIVLNSLKSLFEGLSLVKNGLNWFVSICRWIVKILLAIFTGWF